MSERTTAEMEAVLRRQSQVDIADRLAELDGKVIELQAEGAELVAELFTPPESAVRYGETIYVDQPSALMARLNDLYQKARDQKLGLDALTIIEARGAVEMYAIIDGLRPPCPTCGGEFETDSPGLVDENEHIEAALRETYRRLVEPCPDCVDGKVSIEQLVATYNAVHGPGPWDDPMYRDGYCEVGCVDRLRAVKP